MGNLQSSEKDKLGATVVLFFLSMGLLILGTSNRADEELGNIFLALAGFSFFLGIIACSQWIDDPGKKE